MLNYVIFKYNVVSSDHKLYIDGMNVGRVYVTQFFGVQVEC